MRKRKPGGQPNNQNAIRHGAFRNLEQLDKRTREAKFLEAVQSELVSSLGGSPSPQEILIIQRTSFKALRCALAEMEMVQNPKSSPELQKLYLSWSKSLREDLRTLGLKKQVREVIDLDDYVTKRYGT